MKPIDLEMGEGEDGKTSKNNITASGRSALTQHVTILDPNQNSNYRRAKWLNDKIKGNVGYEHVRERKGSLRMTKDKDSGIHDDSLSRNSTIYRKTSCSTEDVVGGRSGKRHGQSSSERWRPRMVDEDDGGKVRLRNTCSLNCNVNQYIEDDFLPVPSHGTVDDLEEDADISDSHFGLSRQNGIRHSMKHHMHMHESPTESAFSISSESGGSQLLHGRIPQGELESPMDEKRSGLKHGKDRWKRHSIFFNSSESWMEEGIANSLRDMTPSKASIFESAWTGDSEALANLLPDDLEESTKALASLYDATGRTPLHLAAACGHVEAVKLLLEKGAEVEACDFHHKATALMCAAGCGSLATVQLLIQHGANVNAGYDIGKTALLWAVQAESADCAKVLLENGALQNPPIAYSETSLHIAAALGNLPCLELLIEHGADVTLKKGCSRSTALHLAAEEANIPCIRRLLEAGASHSSQDARGQTPLHIAASSDTDVTAILLAAGADPHITNDDGRTPLHCAVARGSRAAECVRLIIEAGAEVNAQDSYGFTPLHLAGVNESSQCASILLHHGADVTAKTKAGTTVLSVLVRKIPDVVRYLVERLDSAVTIHDHDPGDPDCEIRLDFRAIVPNSEKRVSGKSVKSEQLFYHVPRKETEFLTCLLAAGNKKILAHPLSEAFLHLKWRRVRKFFWASLFFQIALVLLYTFYVLNTYLIKCPYDKNSEGTPLTEEYEEAVSLPFVQEPSPAPPVIDIRAALAATTSLPAGINNNNGRRNGEVAGPRNSTERTRGKRSFGFSWFKLNPKQNVIPTTSSTTTHPPLGMNSLGGKSRFIGADIPLEGPPEDATTENGVEKEEIMYCQLGWSLTVVWCFLIFFTLILAIKEVFQLVQAPLAYVLSSENWGQWALIGSVAVTAWPASKPGLYLSHWQYPAAAVSFLNVFIHNFILNQLSLRILRNVSALMTFSSFLKWDCALIQLKFGIFLAYSLMLLQVGRQPALGLYVQMLGKVAANFGLFILAYVCLLIAFALAFCVIFPGNPAYSSPPLALMKVLTMMVGEVDYQEQFYGDSGNLVPYPIAAHVLHTAFVVFISIILMNLLVWPFMIFRVCRKACLPKSLGILLQKNALLVPSSYSWSYYFRPNDPRDKRIPKELKKAALRLAATRHAAKHALRSHSYDVGKQVSQHGSGTDVQFRRLDQRIDNLQKQIDYTLKTINDNLVKIIENTSVKND